MKVKIWGCRGSLPAPGYQTLKYGGESTCLEVSSETGDRIIIDSGTGIRKFGQEVMGEKGEVSIRLLLTHAHWDHLSGFPFFIPGYLPRFTITVCGGPWPQLSVRNFFARQMEAPYFPVKFSDMKAKFHFGCSCNQGYCEHILPNSDRSILCHSIPLNHPNGGYGFKLVEGDISFVFLTDNEIRHSHEEGKTREEYVAFCRNADLLFHDAQYTEEEYERKKGWGHSTYNDAVQLALDAGVKRLGLFHHDPDRTDEDIEKWTTWCQELIHKAGSSMECFACADGMMVKL